MKSIDQIEREFLYGRLTGVTAQTPLNQMRRMFYAQYVGITAGPSVGLKDLQNQFLFKVINDNGGTPASNYDPDLWREAVAALGVTPSKYVNENRRLLYLNLP